MDSLVKAEIYFEEPLPLHTQRELLCSLYNVTSLKLVDEVEVFSPEKLPLLLLYIPYS